MHLSGHNFYPHPSTWHFWRSVNMSKGSCSRTYMGVQAPKSHWLLVELGYLTLLTCLWQSHPKRNTALYGHFTQEPIDPGSSWASFLKMKSFALSLCYKLDGKISPKTQKRPDQKYQGWCCSEELCFFLFYICFLSSGFCMYALDWGLIGLFKWARMEN